MAKEFKFHPTITAKEIMSAYEQNPLLLNELTEEEQVMYHGIITDALQTMNEKYKALKKKYEEFTKDVEKRFEPGYFNQLTLDLGDKKLEYTVEEVKVFKIRKRKALFDKMVANRDPRGLTISTPGIRNNLQYMKEHYPEHIEEVWESTLGVAIKKED